MFDKEKIIATLKETGFDNNCYWVTSGAAMVLHGVKELTRDIKLKFLTMEAAGYNIIQILRFLKTGGRGNLK